MTETSIYKELAFKNSIKTMEIRETNVAHKTSFSDINLDTEIN